MKISRRHALLGAVATALTAAIGVPAAKALAKSRTPEPITTPLGLWRFRLLRPNLPDYIPLAPKESFIGLDEDFRGQVAPEFISPSQVNESVRDIEAIIFRHCRLADGGTITVQRAK